jgi:hypothetical protein
MKVSGQLHAPAALPPGKSSWYPLDRRLGGAQNRSGRDGEEKNFQLPPGIEPVKGKVVPVLYLVKHRDNFTFYSHSVCV